MAQTVSTYPLEQRSRIRFDIAAGIERRVSEQLNDPDLAKGVFNVLYRGTGLQPVQRVELKRLCDRLAKLRLMDVEMEKLRRKIPDVSLAEVKNYSKPIPG
ncbi:MAG: hypothetical protein ACR2PX_06775 [Endozoicomonas sp.]|uniref:hypothetical protein n=1 Tax=Endozoicomonas sp. TaxID=1892382 RepID=UPI003D9B899C